MPMSVGHEMGLLQSLGAQCTFICYRFIASILTSRQIIERMLNVDTYTNLLDIFYS
jgi:hypothetical protein